MSKVVKQSGQAGVKVRGLTRIGAAFYYRPPQQKGVRPPRVALGTSNFSEAVALALALRENRQPGYTPGTLAFEFKRFMLAREAKKLSRWSLEGDWSVYKIFVKTMGEDLPVAAFTKRKIEGWRDGLVKTGLADASVKTYLLRMHAFFAWMVKDGGINRNPMDDIEMPVVRRTRVERFLTKDERERLIAACDRADIRLMLLLGFHAGLRLNEMIEARCDWLRFWDGGGEIVVKETDTFRPKDREARRIPMNDVLYAFLREMKFTGTYLVRDDVARKKHKYRWEPRKPFGRLVNAAGMKWVGWHTLRHTYATLLVMGGCPVASVARWLGDGIEVTYKNYVGCLPERDHVNAGL